jgi:hypothetical protein
MYDRMPAKLSAHLRSAVIQRWLEGERRDKIAEETGISTGAVTNIVEEWSQNIGFPNADALRELALALKRLAVNPSQCAAGLRVFTIMKRLGLKDEAFESFMLGVYGRCKTLGLAPEDIADYIADLLAFSKKVPFSKIPDYIDGKRKEKIKLQEEIESLQDEIASLEAEKSTIEELRDIALDDEKMTTATIKWWSDLRSELGNYGVPIDDVPSFARLINRIKENYGYDIKKVVEAFSDLQLQGLLLKSYREKIPELERRYNNLKREYLSLEQTMNAWRQTISNCVELANMEFGLKELRLLRDTILEIAVANDIQPDEAVHKFFNDVDGQYNSKIGFETKLRELQTKVGRLVQEEARAQTQLFLTPLVGPSLSRLYQRGVTEQDILDFAELLGNRGGRITSRGAGVGFGVSIHEIRTLITEIRNNGDLNSTLGHLRDRTNNLGSELNSIRSEKESLQMQNEKLLLVLLYSGQIASLFGWHSLSLRNQIVALALAFAKMTYHILNSEQEKLEKPQEHTAGAEGDFKPLILDAKGQYVELPDIKNATTKALDVMLKRLKGDDHITLKEALSKARIALLEEQL